MKKLLLTGLLVGLTAGAYAQGQINLDNNANTQTSTSATTGGLFFLDTGSGPVLINQDFNAAFYGGSSTAALTLLRSFSGAATANDNALGAGTFTDPTGAFAVVPGVQSGLAFFKIEAWIGASTTFAGATTRGTATFQNAVADPAAQPPQTPPDFVSMPAIIISGVPEPSTFALAGLGAAALLIFRRRK